MIKLHIHYISPMVVCQIINIYRDTTIYIFPSTLENIHHLCHEKHLKYETMHSYTVYCDYVRVLLVPLFVIEEQYLEKMLVEFGLTQHLAA